MITLFVTSIIQVASQLKLDKLLFEKPMPSEHYLYDGSLLDDLFSAISLIDRCVRETSAERGHQARADCGGLLTVSSPIPATRAMRSKMQLPLIARDLNFAAAIMSLVLWSGLIFSPAKDKTLLLVTAGIGMKFAGEAIGMSPDYYDAVPLLPGVFMASTSHLLLLYIWWQAFRRHRKRL